MQRRSLGSTPAQVAEELAYQRALLDRFRSRPGPEMCDFMGRRFVVHPCVFEPNLDSRALIEALPHVSFGRFLEVGGGTGVVSVFAAERGACGVVVDVNPAAVENIHANIQEHGLAERLEARLGDLLEGVSGRFDLVIGNLPFMRGPAEDMVARAIYDPTLDTWRRFLTEVPGHLSPGGVVLTVLPNFCAFDEILSMARDAGLRAEEVGRVVEDWMVFPSYVLRVA